MNSRWAHPFSARSMEQFPFSVPRSSGLRDGGVDLADELGGRGPASAAAMQSASSRGS